MSRRALEISILSLGVVLILAFAIHFAGSNPTHVFHDIWVSNFGSGEKVSSMLTRFTPLLIAGVGVHIGLRAGLFNIGAEGQFVVGALAAGIVGSRFPGVIGLIVAIFAGCIAGGLWAAPAGYIKAYRGGHEVITTIMMNSIAGFLAIGLVAGPFKAPHQESPMTNQVLEKIPNLHFGTLTVPIALIFGITFPFLFAVYRKRTVGGFELEATGANLRASEYAGIDTKRIVTRAMILSGEIAGLAGAIQVLAFNGRFFPDISSGTGFDALGVALLAGSSPIGIIPAALGFGILSQSAPLLQIDGMPKGIVDVLLGLLIAVGAALRFRKMRSAIESH